VHDKRGKAAMDAAGPCHANCVSHGWAKIESPW